MKATYPKALRQSGRSEGSVRRDHRRPKDLALTRLTRRLLRQILEETDNLALRVGLRRAAAEAESLAWLTPVPMLVLPALLDEKAREARLYASRQAAVRDASREWLSLAE